MRYLRNYPNFSIFILSLLSFGLLSIFTGKEISWDMCNYHFYNAYAFLHESAKQNYWPTSFFHQYLNPTLDLPAYALITFFNDYTVSFWQGAIHGVNFFLLYLISKSFLHKDHHPAFALFIALIGICSPIILPGIGSFSNDAAVSIFVLLFVYIVTQLLQKKENLPLFFLASVILGAGIGLKLTAGCYYVGAALACLFLSIPFKKRLFLLFLLTSGVTVGVLITAGYWMFLMWQQHHNPLFPYFNNIFLSADFSVEHLRDTRYLPKSLLEHFTFPFSMSFGNKTIENGFRDFRFAVLYLIFIVYFISGCFRREKNLATNWLLMFCLFSYITWQLYFSIGRYLMPVELLVPLLIYLLLLKLIPKAHISLATSMVIFSLLIYFLIPHENAHTLLTGKSFFDVKIPPQISSMKNAQVLIGFPQRWDGGNPRPIMHLIAFFPSDFQFIGVPYSNDTPALDSKVTQDITQLLNSKPNTPKFVLLGERNLPTLLSVAKQFGLSQVKECWWIKDDRQFIYRKKVILCQVTA